MFFSCATRAPYGGSISKLNHRAESAVDRDAVLAAFCANWGEAATGAPLALVSMRCATT